MRIYSYAHTTWSLSFPDSALFIINGFKESIHSEKLLSNGIHLLVQEVQDPQQRQPERLHFEDDNPCEWTSCSKLPILAGEK
jgi:hypothetical protein